MAAANVVDALDVANGLDRPYTGTMAVFRRPGEISVIDAMAVLQIRSRGAFYNLIDSLEADGYELAHKPHPRAKRRYYLRAEIEAYQRGEFDKLPRVQPQGSQD